MCRSWLRPLLLSSLFGQTLHRRIVTVMVVLNFVVICIAAILIDARHYHMSIGKAALEANALIRSFTAKAAFVYRLAGTQQDIMIDNEQELGSLFLRAGKGGSITMGDDILWASDGGVGKVLGSGTSVQDWWEGIETVSDADGEREVYVVQSLEVYLWPEINRGTGLANAKPSDKQPKTFGLIYRVTLAMAPYRREIEAFRHNLAMVVVLAAIVIGVAVHIVMRRQLRPLARLTRSVSDLEAWSSQRIEKHVTDPAELCTLIDSINGFLLDLDEVKQSEQQRHVDLRARLRHVQEAMSGQDMDHAGFMHSISHLLSAVPMKELRTIDKAEQEDVQDIFLRVRGMLRSRLLNLIGKEAEGKSEGAPADVVSVAKRFLTPNASGETFMQNFMRRRHPEDKDAGQVIFSLVCEERNVWVDINESEFYEVIFNLMHNAGKVAKTAVVITIGRTGETVSVVVEDDGPGFPPEGALKRESGDSIEGREEGHGIGLPYVRRVVGGHGGELSLGASDTLGGARVAFVLPLSVRPGTL